MQKEFDFIDSFTKKFNTNLPKGFLGIGDDCAIIPVGKDKDILVSCDMLNEDVHFILKEISAKELAKKTMAVNLSDLASSGAKAIACFLSIGVNKNISDDFMQEFMQTIYEECLKYNCFLLGGDTTSSSKMTINLTVMGEVKNHKYKTRNTAKKGDYVCCTGYLGNSSAGLNIILENLERNSIANELIFCHHNPTPRLNEGFFLANQDSVHAMMDISDGISSDLKHILKLSNCSAIIYLDQLPISQTLKDYYPNPNQRYNFALCGGEDYELLFTIDSKNFAKIQKEFTSKFNLPLSVIGKIIEGEENKIYFQENGQITNGFYNLNNGFDHFA